MNAIAVRTAIGSCITLASAMAFGQAEVPPGLATSEGKPSDFIIRLEHVPVTDVVESLQQLTRGHDEIRLVALPLSNSILVFGVKQEDAAGYRDLVELIDRKPPTIEVDVTLFQSKVSADDDDNVTDLAGYVAKLSAKLADLEKSGEITLLERLHVTTLDHQLAQLQVGRNAAVTRGRTFGGSGSRDGFGRTAQSVMSMEAVGTMMTLTPRASGEDVLLELTVEKSWVPKTAPSSDETDESAAMVDETEKFSIRSTVRVPPGQAVHLSGFAVNADGKQSRLHAIVTAKVTP